ncbi:MAG: hypothetical protein J6K39_02230 [Clostridia bacterium]|nr:hypothetical protein [Clostridia bacterium]
MKKFSFLSLSIFVVAVCACISCGYLLSTVLDASGFLSTANVTIEQQTVYAVSMNSSSVKKEVEAQAESLKSQNGAGYVLEYENRHHIIASVYANKNDAELVKNNLKNSGTACEILAITLLTNKIDGTFDANEKTILSNCLKAKFDCFEKLYDVAISLDTGVFDKTKAKLECNSIYSSFVSTKANFDAFFKEKNLDEIESSLKTIETHLSNLISENYSSTAQTFPSLIKHTYCQILFCA